MTCTVTWRRSAEDKLAKLWMAAPDREQVADAADRIDELLRRDPNAQGESRWEQTRFLNLPPLAVYFDVSEQDRQVHVWAVWHP